MCFHGTGDLHRCQHKTTGRVEHEIDRHIVGRLLGRRNDRLGTLQIDVPGDDEAEKAAFFLTMDHRDNTGPVRSFNCADRLGTRRTAYHRPVNKGSNTRTIKKSKRPTRDRTPLVSRNPTGLVR